MQLETKNVNVVVVELVAVSVVVKKIVVVITDTTGLMSPLIKSAICWK